MRIIRYIIFLFASLCAIHLHASGYVGTHVSETDHLESNPSNFTPLSNADVDIFSGITSKIVPAECLCYADSQIFKSNLLSIASIATDVAFGFDIGYNLDP